MQVDDLGDGDINDRGHVWVRPAFDEAIACFAEGVRQGGNIASAEPRRAHSPDILTPIDSNSTSAFNTNKALSFNHPLNLTI